MRTGVRYARNAPPLRATPVQAAGFFLFASAYSALLPVLARSQLHGDPTLYGVLLGRWSGGGRGSISAAEAEGKMGANGMVVLGELGSAVALVLFGLAQNAVTAFLACLLRASPGLRCSRPSRYGPVAPPEWSGGAGWRHM